MAYTFVRVPSLVLKNRDLDVYDRMVYVAICSFSDNDGKCYPGYKHIAARAGCSRGKVIKCVKKLERLGYIKVTRRERATSDDTTANSTNFYHIAEYRSVMSGKEVTVFPQENLSARGRGNRDEPRSTDSVLRVVDEIDPKTTSEDDHTTIQTEAERNEVERHFHGPHGRVLLSDGEVSYLIERLGADETERYIIRMDRHIEVHGFEYNPSSYFETIMRWATTDHREKRSFFGTTSIA